MPAQEDEPIFVRRKGASLSPEVLTPPTVHRVDWRASCLLNVALQTSFSLHISVCRRALYQ